MPGVARKRVSFDTEVLPQPNASQRTDGEATAAAGARSGLGLPQSPEPGRLRGAAGVVMARLDRAMRSVSVRRLVRVLGAVVALMTALAYPVGYGVIGYWKGAELLSFKADLGALRAAAFIQDNEADWRHAPERLARASDVRSPNSPPLRQRIVEQDGTVAAESGDLLSGTTYARAAPIMVGGTVVGRVVAIESLRPLLREVGLIALVSLTLGAAAYLVFASLPLKALDHTLGELESANSRFRQQNSLLDAALANMFQGLAMLDADERLVIANGRFAEMYGLSLKQLQPGTPLRRILELRFTTGHPAGETVDGELQIIRQHLARRKVSHLAERLSDGRAILVSIRPRPEGGWVTTHQDVTERENLNAELAQHNELLKQREDQLKAHNEQFDAALKNMSQGLCMFDAEQRVVIANLHFAQMYGLTPEQVRPGTTLRQIVDARIAAGIYAGEPKSYLREQLLTFEEATMRIDHLNDRRDICVLRQPMRGGGWVTTHEDVTERQQLHAQVEQQKAQLDAALNNMCQGLAMFDCGQRLLLCNKLYADMYGLDEDRVRPGTTLRRIVEAQVASGVYSDENADEMLGWMSGRSEGKGTTHTTSVLRDGRSIAVSAQQMPGGDTVTTHRDITEQRRAEARIVHMALHDTLTGLPNRVLLNERLEQSLTRVRRGEVVAVHLLDLDHFKSVNDTLGHPAGDKLLKMVTERLRALVRETDTVARMGGDEFAVVQVAIAQPADATSLAHRIIEVVSKPYDIEGQQVMIGTSVGIAMGPADGLSPEALIGNADLALYRAKGDGRGAVCFFEREMDAQMQAGRAMEYDLRRALAAGEFELHYQPFINLVSNDICGFEAFLRWRHPKNGMVQPGAFIPLAEKMGSINPLGEWVIRHACATAATWPEALKVAVNVSPVQFRSPGLEEIVVSALDAAGLAPERLELEVTELVLLGDSEATRSVLSALRELGVRIAMDNFGTGYSSLSHLQSFPFDKIKIHRSFVTGMAVDPGSLNLVRAATAMAHGLGMATSAEGVETAEQLEIVRAEGCTEVQGFLFSPPARADEIENLLKSNGRLVHRRGADNAA